MKNSIKLKISAATACAALFIVAPSMAQQVTLMTGPQGGVWVPLGGALKGLWEKVIPGLQVTATPGAGIANVRGVDEGKVQLGFGNSSSTVDGLAGRPPYKKKVTKVCNMGSLYSQLFQVVALQSANVKSFADLKGKALVTQPKGNTGELLTDLILKANDMSYKSLAKANFQASYTDAVSLMKDGHAQVFTLGTTSPASAIMDLASARDVTLVPVDDKTMAYMKNLNPGYNRLIIKAGTYPKQTQDVPAIGYKMHVVVACSMPEKTVYEMVKAIATNVPALVAISKSIDGLTPKAMATDIGVPMHPGATKYYKEVGAL